MVGGQAGYAGAATGRVTMAGSSPPGSRTVPLPPLPIDDLLPAIGEAVQSAGLAVIQAPPGAGKTTRVPPLLAGAVAGQILVLEPRRVAARAAARRIAEEQGWQLGREVGYQVRFERVASEATRVLVVTEGIALQRLQADPLLEGVGALVFDEQHERSLTGDLTLALARKVRREVRPDLALVVMSATLEAAPVAAWLGGAPVLTSEGRLFPVAVSLVSRPDPRPLAAQVASASRRLLAATAGDLLVFLPGVAEIERAAAALADLAREQGLAVVPLYGDLPAEQQDAALRRGARRRIVLATNVAETSITLEGVDAVIDSGLVRQAELDPGPGLDRLVVTRISRASAAQRAGRAGRQGPGTCLRLWTAAEDASLAERTLPEIRRVDLAGAALQLLAWGETDLTAFGWLEAPEPSRLAAAMELLARLGATAGGRLTPRGRKMASLPLHPRLARLLLAGRELGCLARAALAASLLAERSPFSRDATAGPPPSTRSDLLEQVVALERFERGSRRGFVAEGLRAGGARRVLAVRDQLLGLLPGAKAPENGGGGGDDDTFLRGLLAAFPDRLARRREAGSERAVLVGGRGVRLAPASGVRNAELFLCLDLNAGPRGAHSEALVRLASAVEPEWLAEVAPESTTGNLELAFDPERGRVIAWERRRFLDLVLAEKEVPVPPAAAEEALAAAAAAQLEKVLPLAEPAFAGLLTRLRCLRSWMPELALPAFATAELCALLPSLAAGKRSLDELRRLPWLEVLQGLLSPSQRAALDREAPERLAVPSGSLIRLHYEEGRPPVLAARIQELFGLAETPRLAAGRVPVLLHLLAPNGRPQQVTQDLASFWNEVYPQVRKELAGRYPKHAWPSDPWTAQPERRPRRPRS